ncbi:hypothetical protein [Dactylosporangium fulvum]|uniref:hypothetical protein n=1 Tax=Dactylosporangium fulvum TaxID=53359 RepID=UPI0031D8DD1B
MLDRLRLQRLAGPTRWVVLGIAVASVTAFLVAQRQSTDTTYGRSPSTATITEGSAGEISGATLPSVEEMTAMVAAERVVRLPGAVAEWDTGRVSAAIGTSDVRILVAPPGLTKDQQGEVRKVENATIRVLGTKVSGGFYQASGSTLTEWRDQFARNDVTGQLVELIRALRKDAGRPAAADDDAAGGGVWRDPTAAELDTVAAALRADGRYIASGATIKAAPAKAAEEAFGTRSTLVVALPVQPRDTPAPRFGPRLAELFPDRPIVVMYGAWIEYHGPHTADFADVTAASFYARFGNRLSAYAYPQDNVLGAYLALVTDVRYAGLFDRPLPYRPVDPLRVALPVLPWLFAACVAAFLVLSARALPGPRPPKGLAVAGRDGVRARLAGLTALAVEVSGLTDNRTDAALTRAISSLGAAGKALDAQLPDQHVRGLLDDAERELDSVGRAVGVAGYRPAEYLRGRLA